MSPGASEVTEARIRQSTNGGKGRVTCAASRKQGSRSVRIRTVTSSVRPTRGPPFAPASQRSANAGRWRTSSPEIEVLIKGTCHCANIALELEWGGDPPEIPARACGCSFCFKHGGVWTSTPDAHLVVTIRDPALVSKYAFGTRTATFYICS